MESKEEILLAIRNFLNQSAIFESQIIAFENKLSRQIKSKEIKTFFVDQILAVKSCVKNGLYVPPKKSDVYKDEINRYSHSANKIRNNGITKNKYLDLKTHNIDKKNKVFKILNKVEMMRAKRILIKQKKLTALKNNILGLTIKELAFELKIPSTYLISIFEESKILKKSYDIIENIDYQFIEYFIISRFITLKKTDKKKLLIDKSLNNKHGSFSHSAGVYSQIAKFGLGKLIYIRSK
jgi:hypothetical protein